MVIGIDIGGTTTKIVSLVNGEACKLFTVVAKDPVVSEWGALGKLIDTNGISINEIEKIAVTGVGASFIKSGIIGKPVSKIDEFQAIGRGGLHLSNMEKAIIVSIGTGTAIVSAEGEKITYLGGSGIGGGTLIGLSKCILGTTDINHIIETARKGDLGNIDLAISDISDAKIGNLPPDATASNFSKLSDKAGESDLALGIINLVFQTIGVIAMFASRQTGNRDIVLTGRLALVPQAGDILDGISRIYGVNFHIPENAEYATAIGAALL
jgi:type II pantothenate kinase